MDPETARFYEENAGRLAIDHSLVDPSYFDLLEQVFESSNSILDVGCGTGRDTLHFLSIGKNAVGVDASPEMVSEAKDLLRRRGYDADQRLFLGELPRLEQIPDTSFDGVLCSGVLMHLPEEEVFDAVCGFRRILCPSGILFVSVPESRSDVDPKTCRDHQGRLFSMVPAAKLQLLFERVGFALERSETTDDSLGRKGVRWRTLVFRHLGELRDRPLQLVESILNRDQKVATYKLALFRALAEIAQTRPNIADYRPDGKVAVPNELVAEKWLFYYWPVFAEEDPIKQGTSSRARGSDVAIRPVIEALVKHYADCGGLPAFYVDWRSGNLKGEAVRLARSALSKVKQTVWNMPVRHAGGGDFDVLQYDRASKSILMDASLWRELCLTGNWIQDATILRWAELTERINDGAIKASRMFDCLLTVPDAKRNVEDARRFFLSQKDRTCVWTNRSIPKDFAIDHAIPFSLWRNNDLWNLLPASIEANNRKSDRLPTYKLLQRRRDLIIHYWRGLEEALGERFRREALNLLGSDTLPSDSWEPLLFSRFVEAFETTAAQRGAARWEPAETNGEVEQKWRISLPNFPTSDLVVSEPTASSKKADLFEELAQDSTPQNTPDQKTEPHLTSYDGVGDEAFRTFLPLAASLAAGRPFHGFDSEELSAFEQFDWVAVPSRLAKERRFVVRVGGRSMEPVLTMGDLVIFEYHRSPREQNQIVIANIPEFGSDSVGTEAIKRLRIEQDHWAFLSENPEFDPIRVSKHDIRYPILGIMIGKVE